MQSSIAIEPTAKHSLEASVDGRTARVLPMPTVQPLDFSEKRLVAWLLAVVDLGCVHAAFRPGRVIRTAAPPLGPVDLSGSAQSSSRIASLLIPLGCWLAGLYPGYGLAPVERLRKRVKSTVIGFCGIFALDSLAHYSVGSRGVIVASLPTAAVIAPA